MKIENVYETRIFNKLSFSRLRLLLATFMIILVILNLIVFFSTYNYLYIFSSLMVLLSAWMSVGGLFRSEYNLFSKRSMVTCSGSISDVLNEICKMHKDIEVVERKANGNLNVTVVFFFKDENNALPWILENA